MRRKLFLRSSFGQSLYLVCDDCIGCPADLEFFFSPPAVQLGRPLKLALLAGADGSFFLYCHVSSFGNKKVGSSRQETVLF